MSLNTMIFSVSGKMSVSQRKFELFLRQQGAQGVTKTVTRKCTHLVVASLETINENNSKVVDARKNNIVIVDEAWCRGLATVVDSLEFNVLLAKKYTGQSVEGWWWSEKLDGVRAVWTGTHFRSRTGNRLNVPKEFYAAFPTSIVLDGELFCGRGRFDFANGLVRTTTTNYNDWRDTMTFHVFDAPLVSGTFEERDAFLHQHVQDAGHLVLCTHRQLRNAAELATLLETTVTAGGEGIMLRKPGSLYENKRSSTLLKVKPMHDDECVVIGHEDGRGKYRGMCGALVCEYQGKMFKVGSGLTDADRRNPPKMGATITFGYFEITKKGVPRHPTFKRLFEGRL